MKIRIIVITALYFLILLPSQAQTGMKAFMQVPDSTKPFTLENFYELIRINHPVVKQAALLGEMAKQEIRLAKGNFDPKLEAEFLSKQYEGKEYYSIFNSSIKFPTVFPVDPVVGFDRNSGVNLNPERYISSDFDYKQFYAGIAIPLGRGLITDERRTTLKQAELLRTMNEVEQVKLINKFLLEATKAYWQWNYSYYNYKLLNQSITVANELFNRVKLNYSMGEASGIDTLQAKITLQQRTIEQQEALLEFKNQGLVISTYLWDSLMNPLTLDMQWVPVSIDQPDLQPDVLQTLLEQAKVNHPDLQKLEIKLEQLENERKLAAENLKPQLNLNYYLIDQPFSSNGTNSITFDDNYKLGLDFSFPLFLRKERAKLNMTKLKVSNTSYEKALAERIVINEVLNSYNRLINLQGIVKTQHDMAVNYDRLLQAELLNLEQGESDLFKINLQMEKLIAAQSKWLKVVTEFEKERAYLYWAAGIRNLYF